MAKHHDFGRFGEQEAADFLIKKGYQVLARNYRYLKAEVDIIALKQNILAIVEVKSRNKGFVEDLSLAVSQKKIQLLVLAANHYVQESELDVEVRFDIVTVIKEDKAYTLEHLESAFHYF